ncbi:tRNA lysidine(34) synthetase TilS [Halopseudomonas bauzanensis]|uniref:tRNA(Ile)-lysidine synthase n=1 Tax=Halopseudomonas bauzanensis TaxID=653930 RepID=A0A1H9VST4_9GAMM|nr:tRNA lysidine(34) synthetase TilS [Halopseudomonas bauzanensis]SES24609.1 tRNA(Ile)-lysidine synthase [Halopseudomonas bauzanensis]SFM26023.1 tRNA(Ile)-lysidine synthase [Halopseudomonas bauzanensis]
MFTLQGLLQQLAPCRGAPACWLGLSGGLDSMVLLDALVQLRRDHPLPHLKAIHVHHGLHTDADRWTEHCARECAARDIPLHIERVQLPDGGSIEELARDARYGVFERLLETGDWLLLAHHADDQLETLLFRLLRGTGLRGLAGMPSSRVLGAGQLLRPLLPWSRQQLADWARHRQLNWIDDPANADPRYARTALRHELLPQLRQRWPSMPQNLLRLAEHATEANELLDERAAEDLSLAAGGVIDDWLCCWPSLDMTILATLTAARQKNLLRYWLHSHAIRLPDQRHLHSLMSQLGAAADGQPIVQLDGAQLHRSSGRLWLLPAGGVPAGVDQPLAQLTDTRLTAGNGRLYLRPGAGIAIREGVWRIGYRCGGEQIKLPGRPRQSLKDLFQQAGIPVWLRPAIPLLYCDNQLISVAGRWTAEGAAAGSSEAGFSVCWEPVLD